MTEWVFLQTEWQISIEKDTTEPIRLQRPFTLHLNLSELTSRRRFVPIVLVTLIKGWKRAQSKT